MQVYVEKKKHSCECKSLQPFVCILELPFSAFLNMRHMPNVSKNYSKCLRLLELSLENISFKSDLEVL